LGTNPLKICAVTGSRADWGLLSPPLALLRADKAFALDLVVTGQHLVPAEGNTAQEIEREGFAISARVDMLLASDTPVAVAKSMGLAVAGFADAFARLAPDLVFVLGDRYEILAAVEAAVVARLPVAHLCGGDITEGAMDDAIRHAITKLSHLHFVTNEAAAQRLRQLGEDPDRVHCVGSPGLDRIRQTKLLDRAAFFQRIGLAPRAANLLVTFHPETLNTDTLGQCLEMLVALHELGPESGLIFTGSNADPGGRGVDRLVGEFVATHDNACAHASLGAELYFSALRHARAVVGNSSSGLYEAPSFKIPTVNIGDRQRGRLRAASVIDCAAERRAIEAAIRRALTLDCTGVVNPYGDGHASERIVAVLRSLGDPRQLVRKRFVDWEAP
jgi:UDP-N-acetylglucosamine 2-epimerase (non-hydrolysing)/GDP/UDP-N,N'-diacetylbacillosamine 2-epimerase (hydrolysing)